MDPGQAPTISPSSSGDVLDTNLSSAVAVVLFGKVSICGVLISARPSILIMSWTTRLDPVFNVRISRADDRGSEVENEPHLGSEVKSNTQVVASSRPFP